MGIPWREGRGWRDATGCTKKRNTRRREDQKRKVSKMETFYYVVESIESDYANLRRTDIESDDLKLVARALLPPEIMEGTKLKYEMMQYSIIE